MQNKPIGILDSGIGGLTVTQEIVKLLPQESIVYACDSANTPYGARTPWEIYEGAKKLVDFLLEKEVKLIVIACNTITVHCIEQLRHDYPDVPIIGAVPVIKTAVEKTKNKRIGILATSQTVQSPLQESLITQYAKGMHVYAHGTDLLVPLIERGIVKGHEIDLVLATIMKKFAEEKVDTIALGCTHYPFIRQSIHKHLGKNVALLDSGAAIARHVQRVLLFNSTLTTQNKPTYKFYTSGKEAVMNGFLQNMKLPSYTIGRLV